MATVPRMLFNGPWCGVGGKAIAYAEGRRREPEAPSPPAPLAIGRGGRTVRRFRELPKPVAPAFLSLG